jgi:hypothetical protein
MENLQEKDQHLWQTAKARVGFKKNLISYVIFNAFFWCIWFITKSKVDDFTGIPWPIWSTIGWGIGVVSHYFRAYHFDSNAIENEYDKLKNKY